MSSINYEALVSVFKDFWNDGLVQMSNFTCAQPNCYIAIWVDLNNLSSTGDSDVEILQVSKSVGNDRQEFPNIKCQITQKNNQ